MTIEKGHESDQVPRSDPTERTTENLQREIANVRELFEARINASDKAVDRLQIVIDKVPQVVEQAVSRLQEIHDEKFSSIETQFRERDTRTEQTSKDSKVAVDAALQAAKEAVGAQQTANASSIDKSEKATSKQIDSIVALLTTTTTATNDKIEDLKSRVTSMESGKRGSSEGLGSIGYAITIACTIIAVLISLASLGFVMTHNWK